MNWFINPALLSGLALISVPIVLHLIARRPRREVDWAAMDFLLAGEKRVTSRLRLLHLLLLLLRILLIGFLVLALARPFLPDTSPLAFLGERRSSAIVLLDNSFSMAARSGNVSPFEKGVQWIRTISARMNADDPLEIHLVNETTVSAYVGTGGGTGLEGVLNELSVSSSATRMEQGLVTAINRIEESGYPFPTIYLITDLQAGAWLPTGEADGSRILEDLAKRVAGLPQPVRLLLIDVGATTNNRAITDLRIDQSLIVPGKEFTLEILLERWQPAGPSGEPDTGATLYVGENLRAVSPIQWSGNKGRAVFRITPDRAEDLWGWVEILSDALQIDDRRYFSLEVREPLRILVVDGNPGVRADRSEVFFLERALSPPDPGGPNQGSIRTVIRGETQLAGMNPSEFDAILLAGTGPLPPDFMSALRIWVNEGGGLGIFPSEKTASTSLKEQLADLLPADLELMEPALGAESPMVHLGRSDFRHPILAGFSRQAREQLDEVQVTRHYRLNPMSEARPVLWLTSGLPALVERSVGKGRTLLFAFPARMDWTDFPVRTIFLPFLHHLGLYLSGNEYPERELGIGQTFLVRQEPHAMAPEMKNTKGDILGLFESLPEESARGIFPSSRKRYTYPGVDTPGIYHVQMQAMEGTGAQRSFAVNIPNHESNLSRIDPDRLRELLSPFSPEFLERGEDNGNPMEGGVRELWRAVLFLVFLAAFLEPLVARRIDRPAR